MPSSRSRVGASAMVAFVLALWSGISLYGQTPRVPSSQDSLLLVPVIAEVPEFSRYEHPAQCAWTGQWVEGHFWRDKRPDTVSASRGGVPLQRVTRETVRRCIGQFKIETVPERDLLGFGKAALIAEHYTDADAAFSRLATLASTRPVPRRAWTLHLIVDTYLRNAQPRLESARPYVVRLDALGAPAAVERMLAHLACARVAHAQDSIPLWDRDVTAALTASREIIGEARKEYALEVTEVYAELSALRARQNNFVEAKRTVVDGERTWGALRPALAPQYANMASWFILPGRPAPRIQASLWSGRERGDTVHPMVGRAALYFFGQANCPACAPTYALVKRLVATYGSSLDVTLMTRTGGYYLDRLVDADSEAILSQRHFAVLWDLPATVAIWKTPLARSADGQITVLSDPNGTNYPIPESMDPVAFIVDQSGRVRLVTTFARINEPLVRDVLDEIIGPTRPQ